MKQSPQDKALEDMLRSGRLTNGGFLGTDTRCLADIITQDVAVLEQLGYTPTLVVERMQELRDLAYPSLGNWVQAGKRIQVKSEDYKGMIVCPWPHAGRYEKCITTVQHLDTEKIIVWTDLNIHLIAEHSFFEGRGAFFRIEPDELISIIFHG